MKKGKSKSEAKMEIVTRLEEEGFVHTDGAFRRGSLKVEIDYDSTTGEPVRNVKFFEPGNDKPVFHTNADVYPAETFWDKFLSSGK
jgi:hypothetical protein